MVGNFFILINQVIRGATEFLEESKEINTKEECDEQKVNWNVALDTENGRIRVEIIVWHHERYRGRHWLRCMQLSLVKI